jgi:hypothetical protein
MKKLAVTLIAAGGLLAGSLAYVPAFAAHFGDSGYSANRGYSGYSGDPRYAYSGHSGYPRYPAQYDRRPTRWDRDGDGIANRYDRDRDGDGVPNRFDRYPDNRRWY